MPLLDVVTPGENDPRASGSLPPERRALLAIWWVLSYQGYTISINGIAAPFIARSFGLGGGGIATLYMWIASASFLVLFLSHLADRVGRRRVLLACQVATPLAAIAAAAARTPALFVLFDVVLYASIGTAVSCAVVMLAELLPAGRRAGGQSAGGLSAAVGAGLCVVLMPLLDQGGHSWRWLLVLSGAGLVTFPALVWAVPESTLWERAVTGVGVRAGRLWDVLGPRHRSRTVPLLTSMFLGVVAGGSTEAWGYYHGMVTVGLSAASTSAVVLVGGGLGMLGFPLGAWGCERVGRVPTVVAGWMLAGVGAMAFYWGPPSRLGLPTVWLGATFFWFMTARNAVVVGLRAASTELVPTSLRSALMGWSALLGALGAVTAQGIIALLAAPWGGLSTVVGYLAILMVPGALLFGLFVDETRKTHLPD